MSYNYRLITDELVSRGGVLRTELFFYDGHVLEDVFNLFLKFCQENLDLKSKEFDITPARIFIKNENSVNAFASNFNKYYVVAINSGTIVNLFAFFNSKAKIFTEKKLFFLNSFNSKLAELCNAPVYYLMQQVCNQFTYYHELAHLIQMSPGKPTIISEAYFTGGGNFDRNSHIYEFDADIYASENVAFHLIEFWKKSPELIRNSQNLSYLISIGAVSIFSYFMQLMKIAKGIYYAEFSHPHPLIRISYIVDCFIRTIEGNIGTQNGLNSKVILNDAFKILDELFINDPSNIITNFVQMFWTEKNKIKDYVDSEIIHFVEQMPELTYNRIRL